MMQHLLFSTNGLKVAVIRLYRIMVFNRKGDGPLADSIRFAVPPKSNFPNKDP